MSITKKIKTSQHYNAFTLAEVLITLAIIGVVAAIVLPILSKTYQKITYVTGLKREYSVFSQATTQLKTDNGGTLVDAAEWGRNQGQVLNTYKKYLKFAKICDDTPGCWHPTNTWYDLNGGKVSSNIDTDYGSAILDDGSLVNYVALENDCIATTYRDKDGNGAACGYVGIDINGFKPPNMKGRDIFSFLITKDGLMPTGIQREEDWDYYCSLKYNSFPQNGDFCAARVLSKGEMDY